MKVKSCEGYLRASSLTKKSYPLTTILGMLQERKTMTMHIRIKQSLISLLMLLLDLKWRNLHKIIDNLHLNETSILQPYSPKNLVVEHNDSHPREEAGKNKSEPVDVEPGESKYEYIQKNEFLILDIVKIFPKTT